MFVPGIKVALLSRSNALLLYDAFQGDVGAPVASPRACQPGPGNVVLTSGISLSAGKAIIPVSNSLALTPINATRRNGYALGVQLDSASTSHFDVILGTGLSLKINSSYFYYDSLTAALNVGTVPASPNLTIWLVLRSAGMFLFINNVLMFCSLNSSPAIAASVASNLNTVNVDWIKMLVLGGALSTDYGVSTVNTAAPANNSLHTGDLNGIFDFEFTLPGSPTIGDKISLHYRQLDSNDYWEAYLLRGANWDFFLDSVSSGIPTNRINALSVGTPDAIRVVVNGDLHNCYTKAATTWTKRGGEINNATHNTQTTLSPDYNAGTAVRLVSYPRTSSLYNILAQV